MFIPPMLLQTAPGPFSHGDFMYEPNIDDDPVKYNSQHNSQQAGDEYVNDDDLLFIVNQILNNPDYLPNT